MTDTQPSDDESTDDTIETIEFKNADADSGPTMSAMEFVTKLQALNDVEHTLHKLQRDVATISSGLREEDAVRLIYGRNGNWSLSDIRSLFDTLDTIHGASDRKLIVRLLADLGNQKLNDAEEFYEELTRLRERYGDLAETEGDQ